jgi:hypothetical protein
MCIILCHPAFLERNQNKKKCFSVSELSNQIPSPKKRVGEPQKKKESDFLFG